MRRRIWCETVPPEALAASSTVTLLLRHAVDPILAVWPETTDAVLAAAARFQAEGLHPALWPMLADADGRWLGAANAETFCAHAERLAARAPGLEIVLDLEPPIEALRTTLLPPGAGAAALRAARERIASLVARLHASGAPVSAAVALPVLLDRPGRPVWQELLGTPADGIRWDHVSPMLYTSILEGWSRGLVRRDDARALLAWSCHEAALRFGPIAGASLGAVGTGAFGDEPVYRDPGELADDVAVARAAGLDDLALFELGGVLRRPPADDWLIPFVSASPAARVPGPTLRARAAIAGARAAGRALGWLSRWRLRPQTPG